MRIEYLDVLEKLSGVHEYADYAAALCPAHSDTSPSMLVFKDGHFRCLACGFSGSYRKLLDKLEGWIAPPIVERKADHFRLPTDLDELEVVVDEAHDFLLTHRDPLANYLFKRGVGNRIVPQNLGYWQGWYSIPAYDKEKRFLGVVLRAGEHIQNETGARFHIPFGQPTLLYVPSWKDVMDAEFLVVVFGMVDALALCEIGLPVCTATSGKDSMRAEMLDEFRKPILIIPDKGEDETAYKLLKGLGWRGTVIVLDYPSGCKDPADLVQDGFKEMIFDAIKDD